jgi:hypothetical protein
MKTILAALLLLLASCGIPLELQYHGDNASVSYGERGLVIHAK